MATTGGCTEKSYSNQDLHTLFCVEHERKCMHLGAQVIKTLIHLHYPWEYVI